VSWKLRWKAGALVCAASLLAGVAWNAFAQEADPLLRAMKDELERSRQLQIPNLDAPYYIEYRVEDTVSHTIEATLGALIASERNEFRIPTVRVRVGSYNFDNTNHIYSDIYAGGRYDPGRLSLENDYLGFRRALWLATDRAYKTAEEAIARKRSALKNVSLPDELPDFSKTPPVTAILPIEKKPFSPTIWRGKIVKLSGIFSKYPQVLSSVVEMHVSQSTNYIVTSEGSVLRTPEDLVYIRARGYGLAADGSEVRDADVIQAFDADELPPEDELAKTVTAVAERVSALSHAPTGESYDGPVLFEARAAAQMFGQVLGDNLKVTRKPIADPGRNVPHVASELENRIGARILPEWMDVVDDSTQTEFHGHRLFGHYLYDMEGVAPKPVELVEKGVLKTFLLTRTPVYKDFPGSNGHARMPGNFGSRAPGFGNLFIRASQVTPAADMKKKLLDMCRQQNKPYGILVREMDFPSSASVGELRQLAASAAQAGENSRLVTLPLLVYKVYPDGREELVRGVRFRDLSTRSFKEISAASDENYVFDFIDSNAPFALMGAGSFITSASVIAPAVLFDELELEPIQEEIPKPPIVPPPPLSGATPSF
jgi:PmbA/TldA metallopeptidase C-terminal domain